MPDIAKAFKEEIQRLARKEIKAAVGGLRKDSAALKRAVADHKRRLARLERENRRLSTDFEKRRKESVKVTDTEVERARITGKIIRAIRSKLGLSQAELAQLLAVNPQTVYQWEHKEGRLAFRGNAKAAVVEVRKLTKQEARQRLEEAATKVRKRPRRRKKRAK